MNQALLQKKLKDSFGETRFKPSEDSLTSSTIGLLQYLGSDLFWKILREICGDKSKLPVSVGNLQEIYFWRKFLPDLIINVNHVEPDVYCEFEHFNLIIEAKKGDVYGQDENQWRKEITSYFKEIESDKLLLFIAIGGNNSLKTKKIDLDSIGTKHIIYGASWQRMLEACKYIVDHEELTYSDKRILKDTISLFEKHNFYSIRWLKEIHGIEIESKSLKILEKWEYKNPLFSNNSTDLFDLTPININSLTSLSILSSWKIKKKNLKGH